ncbi:LAMI_0H07558g1_1 [Lachancea mirantina]|uniref:LAMI_0H07558g1_1 n=1 Tax=Lachancea mirantina TaxID=1230905 RepID=A0A1G4KFU7_9SACH|nr:LAMI_0H07558g1_1 [Lachancea mirantina]
MSHTDQLFVAEEDDDIMMKNVDTDEIPVGLASLEDEKSAKNDEDPIVKEIPLNLSQAPFALHLLQYPNKPKKTGQNRVLHPPVTQARYKQKSNLWQLDMPLNTDVFYDKNRAEDEWDSVAQQTVKGVGVYNEGLYAGLFADDQIYLLPVDAVAQMRPYFTYIDGGSHTREETRNPQQQNGNGAKKAQVVTMSVKSSSEANQPRLGGSLLAHKVADEEETLELTWVEGTFQSFKESVTTEKARTPLKASGGAQEYVERAM